MCHSQHARNLLSCSRRTTLPVREAGAFWSVPSANARRLRTQLDLLPTASMLTAGVAPEGCLEAGARCACSWQLRQRAHHGQRHDRAHLLHDGSRIGLVNGSQHDRRGSFRRCRRILSPPKRRKKILAGISPPSFAKHARLAESVPYMSLPLRNYENGFVT